MWLQYSYSCKFPASSIFSLAGWPWLPRGGQEPLPLKVAPIQLLSTSNRGETEIAKCGNYLSLNWSISWLLMPWLLASPGHQQPWYWLSLIGKLLPWSSKDLSYLCHINVDEGHKIWIYVMFPLNNLAHKRVKTKLSIYLLHNLPWHSFNSLQHWFC